jgi:hypothetical protein
VYWKFEDPHGILEDQSGDEYWQALDAQQAVDFCREYSAPDGAEILDVAKVVNNWK